jgi:hypothetical protein
VEPLATFGRGSRSATSRPSPNTLARRTFLPLRGSQAARRLTRKLTSCRRARQLLRRHDDAHRNACARTAAVRPHKYGKFIKKLDDDRTHRRIAPELCRAIVALSSDDRFLKPALCSVPDGGQQAADHGAHRGWMAQRNAPTAIGGEPVIWRCCSTSIATRSKRRRARNAIAAIAMGRTSS